MRRVTAAGRMARAKVVPISSPGQGSRRLSHDPSNDDDLARRIAKAQSDASPRVSKREESSGYAIGMEFIGAVLAGGLIGWFLDRWLGSAPWAMIVLLGLGFAAGTRNVIKRSGQFDGSPHDKDGSR